jgi:hypothetical protein
MKGKLMNNVKKFLRAFRENTDDIRKKTAIAILGTAGSLAIALVLTKLNEDRVDVLVIKEVPEEKLLDEPQHSNPTEF